MAKNVDHIQHIKSNVVLEGKPKLPQPSALVEGELAINYADGVEIISIKNSSGDIVTFSSDDYYSKQKLGSAFTDANSAVTVTEYIEENELIVSTALNDLKENKLDASAFTEYWTSGTGENSVVLKGSSGAASGNFSVAEGNGTTAIGANSHAEGDNTIANNQSEHASGQYNNSYSVIGTQFGHSGNTLFSVGNGTATNARHNAFEIRQNGDIYIVNKDGYDVKLQDEIGNITVDQVIDSGTSASTDAVSTSAVYGFVTSYTPSITVDQDFSNTASTNPISTKAVYSAITDNELVWTNAFVALSGTVSSHTENTEIHVTAADKEKLHTHSNKTALDSITGNVGTMAYENKASYSSATEVNTALGNKANTATTLAGYGITNAYTKSETSGATELTTALNGKANTGHTHTLANVTDVTAPISGINSITGAVGTAAFKSVSNGITNSNSLIESKHIYSGVGVTVAYDSETHYIQLKSTSGNILSSFDASSFLVDGMVDSVTLESKSGTTYLVIEWNTAAGKTKTELNIGDIFEADNYLTKTQLTATTDYTTVTKANSANTASTVALTGVTGADDLKAIEALTGTSGLLKKTAANTWALDTTAYSSATQVNTALDGKSNTGHTHDDRYYTEAEIDTLVGSGFTSSSITEVIIENERITSSALNDLNLNKLDASAYTPTDLSNYYTKNETSGASQISTALGNKTDTSTFNTHTASTVHMSTTEKTNLDSLATNIAAISGITSANVVSWNNAVNDVADLSGQSETIAAALNILNDDMAEISGIVDNLVSVTYSELVNLKSTNALIPGTLYRITDYVTTVNTNWVTNAISANHAFDIIVLATDVNVLNENAYAMQHSGDTYFANSNLNKWELKYTVDNINWSLVPITVLTCTNESYKFKTIGSITLDGTDYILLEGDENYQNDWGEHAICDDTNVGTTIYAYYDDGEFSDDSVDTIASVATITDEGKGTITWMKDEFNNECPYDFKNIRFKRWMATDSARRDGLNGCYMIAELNNTPQNLSVEDESDFIYAFTFSSNKTGGTQTDYSLGSHNVTDNVILSYGAALNNIVFFGDNNYGNHFAINCYNNTFGNDCYYNSFGNGCYSNSFGYNNYSNSFGNDCQYNSFGDSCTSSLFGNDCQYNSFGDDNHGNTFGNNFQYNTFVNYCDGNTFGNGCGSNTFGNSCYSNSFGDDNYDNTFGSHCSRNAFGNGCTYNTFGDYFQNNAFWNDCRDNSFGNDCRDNSFGNSSKNNTFGGSCYYNSFGNSCNHITFQKGYIYCCIIENGNQFVNITSTQTTSLSNKLRNITIAQGVNISTTVKTISHNTVNDTFKTTYQPTNSQIISV